MDTVKGESCESGVAGKALLPIFRPVSMKRASLSLHLASGGHLTGQQLRSAIARLCPQYPQLSQRTPSGALIYCHPHVQFKALDGVGVIVALGPEADIVIETFATLPHVVIGGQVVRILDKRLEIDDAPFGPTETFQEFVFTSPWFALNQDNELTYVGSNEKQRRVLLEKILTGNLLSAAKGFGLFCVPRVESRVVGSWSESPSFFKGVSMRGIRCRFETNVAIPHLWGIGKSSSSGWGTVVPLK